MTAISEQHPRTATVTRQPHSTVRIDGEIPYAELLKHRAAALAELGTRISVDGFRKGHIPEKILLERAGEMTLLYEMAERALAIAYPEIIQEQTLDTIGRPQISITKIAKDNPLGFSITVALVPDVTLPDYKKIAGETAKESAAVTDEEVAETIASIQRQKRAYERLQQKAAAKREAEEKGHTLPTSETPSTDEPEENPPVGEEPLPPLTDDYVKTLGEFASVDDFKTKLREHIAKEKEQETASKHRAAITDAIIAASTIDLPRILIDSEIHQMFAAMEHDLERANLSIDAYLDHIKKTREELAQEWAPAAEKRAKLQLILNEIAKREKIEPPAETLEREVARLLAHYKDADKSQVTLYVASTLINEEVFKMLETESANSSPS